MSLFNIIAIILSLTALFSYINYRYLHLQPGVGVMLVAMTVSLALNVVSWLGLEIHPLASRFLSHVRFEDALLRWMLGFLLFAGALTVDLAELRRNRGVVAMLAVVGTLVSAFLVAGLIFFSFRLVGFHERFLSCLLLGALISPTDPVAVLSLVRSVGASRRIETIIAGESLFNDGIGVVLFLTLLQWGQDAGSPRVTAAVIMFARQTLGGAALGLGCGALTYVFLRRVHETQLSILLTLSLVMGSFALSERLHVSGPIAAVAAGVLIGNHGWIFHMADDISQTLLEFWDLIDQILNSVLFMLMGLEILAMPFRVNYAWLALLAIPIVMIARWLSVGVIMRLSRAWRNPDDHGMVAILTWGGLRGGLAIAMALSLDNVPARNWIVSTTYAVVAFSIFVQGTTIRKLVERTLIPGAART